MLLLRIDYLEKLNLALTGETRFHLNEKKELENQLDGSENERQAMLRHAKALEEQMLALNTQLSDFQKQQSGRHLAELQRQDELNREREELMSSKNAFNTEKDALLQHHNTLLSESNAVEKQKETLQHENEELKRQHQLLSAQSTARESEHQQSLKDYECVNTSLLNQLDHSALELDELRSGHNSLQQQHDHVQAQNKLWQSSNVSAVEQHIQELETSKEKLADFKQELETTMKTNNALEAANLELKSICAADKLRLQALEKSQWDSTQLYNSSLSTLQQDNSALLEVRLLLEQKVKELTMKAAELERSLHANAKSHLSVPTTTPTGSLSQQKMIEDAVAEALNLQSQHQLELQTTIDSLRHTLASTVDASKQREHAALNSLFEQFAREMEEERRGNALLLEESNATRAATVVVFKWRSMVSLVKLQHSLHSLTRENTRMSKELAEVSVPLPLPAYERNARVDLCPADSDLSDGVRIRQLLMGAQQRFSSLASGTYSFTPLQFDDTSADFLPDLQSFFNDFFLAFESEIQNLSLVVDELQRTEKKTKKVNLTLSTSLQTLERKCLMVEEARRQLEKGCADLRSTLETSTTDHDTLCIELKTTQQRNDALEALMDESTMKQATLEAKVAEQMNRESQAFESVEQLKRSHNLLKAQHDASELSRLKAESEHAEVDEVRQKLKLQLSVAKKTLHDVESAFGELQSTHADTRAQMAEIAESKAEVDVKLLASMGGRASLESNANSIAAQKSIADEKLLLAVREISDFKTRLDVSAKECADLHVKLRAAECTVHDLENRKRGLDASHVDAEAFLLKCQKDSIALEHKYLEATESLREQGETLTAVKEQLTHASRNLEETTRQWKLACELASTRGDEIKKLTQLSSTTASSNSQVVEALQSKLAGVKAKVKKDVQTMNEQILDLQQQLSHSQQETSSLQGALEKTRDSASTSYDMLEHVLMDERKRVRDLERELEEVNSNLKDLSLQQETLVLRERQFVDFQQKLDDLQQKLDVRQYEAQLATAKYQALAHDHQRALNAEKETLRFSEQELEAKLLVLENREATLTSLELERSSKMADVAAKELQLGSQSSEMALREAAIKTLEHRFLLRETHLNTMENDLKRQIVEVNVMNQRVDQKLTEFHAAQHSAQSTHHQAILAYERKISDLHARLRSIEETRGVGGGNISSTTAAIEAPAYDEKLTLQQLHSATPSSSYTAKSPPPPFASFHSRDEKDALEMQMEDALGEYDATMLRVDEFVNFSLSTASALSGKQATNASSLYRRIKSHGHLPLPDSFVQPSTSLYRPMLPSASVHPHAGTAHDINQTENNLWRQEVRVNQVLRDLVQQLQLKVEGGEAENVRLAQESSKTLKNSSDRLLAMERDSTAHQQHASSLQAQLSLLKQQHFDLQEESAHFQKLHPSYTRAAIEAATFQRELSNQLDQSVKAFDALLSDHEQLQRAHRESKKLIYWAKKQASKLSSSDDYRRKAEEQAREIQLVKVELERVKRESENALAATKDKFRRVQESFHSQLHHKSRQLEAAHRDLLVSHRPPTQTEASSLSCCLQTAVTDRERENLQHSIDSSKVRLCWGESKCIHRLSHTHSELSRSLHA